jgi:hypothetical protein
MSLQIKSFNEIKRLYPNVPDITLFYSYKVYPREISFNYMKHRYYIYIYLNPFKEYINDNKLGFINDPLIFFGYEPIYVGKGVNGVGYRFNQHISTYLAGKEKNLIKREKFKEIENLMKKNIPGKPKNWNDYKQNYIIIYRTFKNEKELSIYEMALINKIGTLYTPQNPGPLTNKITNFEMQKIKERIEDELFDS